MAQRIIRDGLAELGENRRTLGAWTDQRDTVPGTDPRYTNGDGTDGFDVHQCRTQNPDGTFSADTCPDDGGLDQNIFGLVW